MALLSDKKRLKREQEECQLAWNLLSTVPEYIKDYNLMVKLRARKSKSNSLKIKAMEKKWGFGTLENPDEESPSFEFLNFFSNYNPEVSRNKRTVDFGGIEHFSRKNGVIHDPEDNACDELKSPSEVTVKIDIEAPIEVILEEVKSGIKHIKSLFDIPKKNTSSHDHLTFLVDTLQNIGLKKSEIIKRLTSKEDLSLPYDHGTREARRKRITRHFKKLDTKVAT